MVYQMKPRAAVRPQPALPYSIQAPVRGLVLTDPLAKPKPGGARVLENWFPTSTGVRTRGGCLKTATIGTAPVRRLWTFKSGQVDEMFASDDENIFRVSNVVDPDTPPAAAVSGQSSGYYSTAQFGTVGGNYLYAVNGADDAQLYDGVTWKPINTLSTPAVTGIATAALSFVWSFASRLFFVEKGTMNAWFLPVDSIGGTANVFSLAGIFQEGGSLLYGGKWSMDAGDGLDDKCVFVSTEGEVAVYQGTNPLSGGDFQKVGVYKITSPLGPNATMQAGGDFLMAVEDGIVPISQAVNKDAAALSLSAVTRNIEPAWKKEVGIRGSLPWEIMKWPSNNMMVVSLPAADESVPTLCFVANLETGAWSFFTGWDVQCMAQYEASGYFGTRSGTIHKMEETGSDDGLPFTCTMVCLPDQMRSPGVYKTVESARATFSANIPFNPKVSVSVDYKIKLPSPPSSAADVANDLWDQGLWDVSIFDAGSGTDIYTRWVSIGNSGFAISPQVQVTSGTNLALNAELVQIDLLYRAGGVMV